MHYVDSQLLRQLCQICDPLFATLTLIRQSENYKHLIDTVQYEDLIICVINITNLAEEKSHNLVIAVVGKYGQAIHFHLGVECYTSPYYIFNCYLMDCDKKSINIKQNTLTFLPSWNPGLRFPSASQEEKKHRSLHSMRI